MFTLPCSLYLDTCISIWLPLDEKTNRRFVLFTTLLKPIRGKIYTFVISFLCLHRLVNYLYNNYAFNCSNSETAVVDIASSYLLDM